MAAFSKAVEAASSETYKAGTKCARQHLGRVLVLGLGKSGISVTRYLVGLLGQRVDSVFIAAGSRNDASVAFLESIKGEGIEWAFGDDALATTDAHFDMCIASPGIPYWHQLYEDGLTCSDELMSEIEFSWRESADDSIWVAITGTNGKTTTTSCCGQVLRSCGLKAAAVGNIGEVCLDAVQAGETDVYVAEVSSYQLYSTTLFSPDIAVLLNITPDHVHWHRTFEAYRDAKFNVLRMSADARSKAGGLCKPVAVLDATNDVVRAKVRELKALPDDERPLDYIPMGTADGLHGDMRAKCGSHNAAFLSDDNTLVVAFDGNEHRLVRADDLQVAGEHNASNVLAAISVAVALGADDAAIAKAAADFQPLAHRIEPCGSVRGISCFNDSKATNVDATVKALMAFPGKNVFVLLGGDDKGTDLTELVEATCAHAVAAVCFGDAGPRFIQAFEQRESLNDGLVIKQAPHMEEALDEALALAEPGDVVLLSPACASFDEFKSFEQRGDIFKRLVAQRAQAGGEA